MPKPTRSTLNRRQVARQLVADAVVPAIQAGVRRVQRVVEESLNAAVNGFFPDLATYMGSPEDMAAQLGAEAGSLGAWKPLTASYIRRKGNDNFWIFTGALGGAELGSIPLYVLKKAHAIRLSKNGKPLGTKVQRAKRVKAVMDASLISTLRSLNGTSVFGPVTVKVRQESLGLMQFKPGDRPVTAMEVHLAVRLWTRWQRAEIANPDRTMFDQGIIDQKTFYKLSNFRDMHPNYYRPLIKPLMSYYGLLKLPKTLQQIARELA